MLIPIPIIQFNPELENSLKNGDTPMLEARKIIVQFRKKFRAGKRRAIILLII